MLHVRFQTTYSLSRMNMSGSRSKLAIEVAADRVAVYVAGRRLTETDDQPYMAAFAASLRATRRRLEACLNYQANEGWFLGKGVDEAYRVLTSADSQLPGSVFDSQRFADWGPITDGHLTFLLPINGKLYLATAAHGDGEIFAAEVNPWDLMSVLAAADDTLHAV